MYFTRKNRKCNREMKLVYGRGEQFIDMLIVSLTLDVVFFCYITVQLSLCLAEIVNIFSYQLRNLPQIPL